MFLILAGVVITFYEVVMRYLFNSPTTWAYKHTLFLGAIVYLTAGAYAMHQRRHIRISTVYKIAPRWLRMILDYLALFVLVVYVTLMLVGGAEPAVDAFLLWIESGRLHKPSMPGTIKPLILIMTVVVVVISIRQLLAENDADAADSTIRPDKDVR